MSKANKPSDLNPNVLKPTLPVNHLLEFVHDLLLALKPNVELALPDVFLDSVHFWDQIRTELCYIKLGA